MLSLKCVNDCKPFARICGMGLHDQLGSVESLCCLVGMSAIQWSRELKCVTSISLKENKLTRPLPIICFYQFSLCIKDILDNILSQLWWWSLFCVKALTSSALQKENRSVGDVAARYKYKNAVVDVKVDTQSNVCSSAKPSVIMIMKQSF